MSCDRIERTGIVKRLWVAWKETWAEYLAEEWGFAVLPHWRPRLPGEPWFWAADSGEDRGGVMRIGCYEVVTSWRIPFAKGVGGLAT